jgi:hypothetical protein
VDHRVTTTLEEERVARTSKGQGEEGMTVITMMVVVPMIIIMTGTTTTLMKMGDQDDKE